MEVIHLGLFFGTSVILALSPGPDNLFVLSQSLRFGWREGFYITLGLCIGLIFHTVAVAIGLATFIQSKPQVFTALKMLGGLYLIYLAWMTSQSDSNLKFEQLQCSSKKRIAKGVLMSVTNPKVTLFFLAFLPQFVPQGIQYFQITILILGLIFMITSLMIFTLISFLSDYLNEILMKSSKRVLFVNRLSALVLASLGLITLIEGTVFAANPPCREIFLSANEPITTGSEELFEVQSFEFDPFNVNEKKNSEEYLREAIHFFVNKKTHQIALSGKDYMELGMMIEEYFYAIKFFNSKNRDKELDQFIKIFHPDFEKELFNPFLRDSDIESLISGLSMSLLEGGVQSGVFVR
tara:strand:- start:575 stop:1627 length:1053 start_codon:yes stop_codon:yes gene_type:complete